METSSTTSLEVLVPPNALIIFPNNKVIKGGEIPFAIAPTVPTNINKQSKESANEKSLYKGTVLAHSSLAFLFESCLLSESPFKSISSDIFLVEDFTHPLLVSNHCKRKAPAGLL